MRASVSFSIRLTGRVEVGDEAGPDHLVLARGEAGREVVERREELHHGKRARVDSTRAWLTETPAASRTAAVKSVSTSSAACWSNCCPSWATTAAFSCGGRVEGLGLADLGEDHAVAVAHHQRGAGLGGEDLGDQRRRGAFGGVAAGQRPGGPERPVEALGERGEGQAAVELGDEAVGERRQRLGGAGGGPVGDDAVADLGERLERRRVDRVDAQRGEAAVRERDQVGLDAGVGLERGLAERRVVGEPAGGAGVERQRAELQRGLGRDLLGGGAAGEQVLDRGGVLVDAPLGLGAGALAGEVGPRRPRTASWSRRGWR